jgi:hypothetical protein
MSIIHRIVLPVLAAAALIFSGNPGPGRRTTPGILTRKIVFRENSQRHNIESLAA